MWWFLALGTEMMTSASSSGAGSGRLFDDLAERDLDDAVGHVIAAEVDQLGAFARGDRGHAGDAHAIERGEVSAAGFGDLHARGAGFFGEADERADHERVGGATLFGGIVHGLIGFDEDGLAGLDESRHTAEMGERFANEGQDAVDRAVLLFGVCDGNCCGHIPDNGAIRIPWCGKVHHGGFGSSVTFAASCRRGITRGTRGC